MDYRVIKVTAKTVTKPGSINDGKKYVECTIQSIQKDDNGNEIAGEVTTAPVFDDDATQYLACIAIANGGTAPQDKPIPEHLVIWRYCFYEDFVFPETMVRVDENGQPRLNKFNQMYQASSVTVMTRYQVDEQVRMLNPTGSILVPKKGWRLNQRGTSVMNSFYMPLKAFQKPAAQGDDPKF